LLESRKSKKHKPEPGKRRTRAGETPSLPSRVTPKDSQIRRPCRMMTRQ
jgi:hypothetical protein